MKKEVAFILRETYFLSTSYKIATKHYIDIQVTF